MGAALFNARNPVPLRAWCMTHLGIDVQGLGRPAFRWTDEPGKPTV